MIHTRPTSNASAVTLAAPVAAGGPPARARSRWRWAAGVTLLAAVFLAALAAGDLALSPSEVWSALTGTANDFTQTVVLAWRLPRALAAVAFGAALGAAGSIFQTLTRNPLGSPDIIGFNTGAYTGVLLALILIPAPGFAATATAALVGGLAAAGLVLLFSSRSGVGGHTFVLAGIAISAALGAWNTWLVYKTDTATATASSVWAAGTLDNTRWELLQPVLIALAVIAAATAMTAPKLRIIELGDDLAHALGLRVGATRLLLVVCAVGLTAVTTAAAGPIMFVALAAPHLARAVLPRTHPTLAAALAGALLLSIADWLAAHAFAPTQLPVGAVTVSIGGVYLTLTILFRKR
ncbi:Ferric enterobactin transport system permease protein FepG [Leucobacter aridicollis]|uniref:FecCD family ABC transporter permease n=1 Tax=Leucobacter aridicollis TaxID=283878 RepID=UPI000EB35265|nr:iron chelate uptake ABC transporter family permease subunit [Leucobacter aridicollis]MCS3427140.1 iron complex transport system permease protein [Leucobacter aridicollis]RKQ85173.1 iron complex transport system permease protein [Mycolicibacterium mucogenicum 261Sha1.1M5]